MLQISISFVFCFITIVSTWNLNNFGISNNHYISSIAIYHNRAFLALPRTICENNVTVPTLVEVPWPEFNAPLFSLRNKLLENQKWEACEDLQNAVSIQMEPKKPRLWVLDKGNKFCNPKILMYNLFLNSITEGVEFENIPKDSLTSIIIDPQSDPNDLRAYIANVEEDKLLVVNLNELKWWKLKLSEANDNLHKHKIDINYMAISKTKPVMYLTGQNSDELFSLDLDYFRNIEEPLAVEADDFIVTTNISFLGNKLGKSSCIETDYKSGLIYYLVRDYAVVRWIIGKPLRAEYHNVLAQSYKNLPYISQIFADQHNNIWALVNNFGPDECENNNEIEESEHLENRVVKILKYNILGDK